MTRINHESYFSWQAQYLVMLERHFSWQVQYLALAVSLFVASAIFGDVAASLIVAGTVFGEIWVDSQRGKCCSFFNTKCVSGAG